MAGGQWCDCPSEFPARGPDLTPAENYNQNFSIATQVSDGTTTLNGNKLFTGTAQDDAPTVTGLNSPETYTEDAGAIDLADIVVSDIDSTEVAVTLALSDLNAGTSALTLRFSNSKLCEWHVDGEWIDRRCEHFAQHSDLYSGSRL